MSKGTRKFQGLCLIQGEGWMYMQAYDYLHPEIRQRLRDSPFNLCAACVFEAHGSEMEMIERMESILRASQDEDFT